MIEIPEAYKQYTNDNLEVQKNNLTKLSKPTLKKIIKNVDPCFFLHYHAELELERRNIKEKKEEFKWR